MTFFCEDCKYINKCEPRKNNPQTIGCCDFGLLDENGLMEDWDESGEEPYTEEQVKLLIALNNLVQDDKENENGKSLL